MDQKKEKIDMLHGPLIKNLLLFTLPIALGSMLQQLFNAAGYFDRGIFWRCGCTCCRRDKRRDHCPDRDALFGTCHRGKCPGSQSDRAMHCSTAAFADTDAG